MHQNKVNMDAGEYFGTRLRMKTIIVSERISDKNQSILKSA